MPSETPDRETQTAYNYTRELHRYYTVYTVPKIAKPNKTGGEKILITPKNYTVPEMV